MPTPTLPTIRNGWYAMYPLAQEDRAPVRILKFRNGGEVRFAKSVSLLRAFTLKYSNVSAADKSALDAFVASTLGQGSTGWTFGLGAKGSTPTPYVNCTFTQDSFSWSQNNNYPTLWNGEIQFRQTIDAYPATAFSSAFPAVQLKFPYTRSRVYKTAVIDMECGRRYTYSFYGNGLTNFPAVGLSKWTLGGTFTDSEVSAIENHWIGCNGQLMQFTFADPDDGLLYLVRYDMPSLKIDRISPNQSAMTIELAEVFPSNVILGGPSSGMLPGGSKPISTATLTVWSAMPLATAPFGGPSINYSTDGGTSFVDLVDAFDGRYALRSDSAGLSIASTNGLLVTCRVDGSLFASGLSQLFIYDCYLDVVYADATTARLRPTRTSTSIGSDLSTISNPGLAIDSDANPPTTYATCNRLHTSGFATGAVLTLTGF